MLKKYFKNLYSRAMQEAYTKAHNEIVKALNNGGSCLDCGAQTGEKYDLLQQKIGFERSNYSGIEWHPKLVESAASKGLNVVQGDLNHELQFHNEQYRCIFALSVIEHLLNPCRFLNEAYRCLEKNGTLVILTPNISTYFTAALILAGKMPSSGPHPDSDSLIKKEELFKVSHDRLQPDSESDTPMHRHLIVFSYRTLRDYLTMVGFKNIQGFGFGLYPFPIFLQSALEKIDPYHCHQMVFIATKP